MFRPSPYEALQVLPPEERELSGKERLLLASGPPAFLVQKGKEGSSMEGKPGPIPDLDL